jgi:menaquinone-dependent protoporphyrinogen IX oxidase
VRDHQEILSTKPTAFFVVCANMYEDTAENRAETEGWLKDALKDLPEIPVLDIGLFGGAVLTSGDDFNKLNFLLKFIIRSMQKSISERTGKEDFRDWVKIRDWADTIAQKLD